MQYRVAEDVPSSRGTARRYRRLCGRCADRQCQIQLLAGADRVEAESLSQEE